MPPPPPWPSRHPARTPPQPRRSHARLRVGHDPVRDRPPAPRRAPPTTRCLRPPTMVRRRLRHGRTLLPRRHLVHHPLPERAQHWLLPCTRQKLGHMPPCVRALSTQNIRGLLPPGQVQPWPTVRRRLYWLNRLPGPVATAQDRLVGSRSQQARRRRHPLPTLRLCGPRQLPCGRMAICLPHGAQHRTPPRPNRARDPHRLPAGHPRPRHHDRR